MMISILVTTLFVFMFRKQGSVQASGIPTTRTDVQYFVNVFPWNEARERCVASGGRLMQPETEREYMYIKSILKELRRKTSLRSMEIWMNMILATPGQRHVVWVNGCSPVTYLDFHGVEPNLLNSDFCIRICTYTTWGRQEGFEWRTTKCNQKESYVCMHQRAAPCSFKTKAKTALSVTTVASEMYAVSQANCTQYCTSQTRSGLECWALTYNNKREECKLYYLQDPFLLTRNYHVTDYNSILQTKDCFQITVNEDDGASSLGDQYPNTPCFNSSISEKATTSRPFTTSSSAKPRTYWMSSQSARPNPSVALTSTRDSYSVEPVSTTQWTPIISTTVPSETSAKQSKVTEASSSLNHLITTESSTSAIITTTRKPTCWCPCGRIIAKKNITKQKFIEELVQGLEISKANLSSNRRRRSSVYERRAVPVTLGSVWVGVLLALYGVVLFSDIFLHGKSSMTASSRGYGYGKRKVRPIEENTNTPSKP